MANTEEDLKPGAGGATKIIPAKPRANKLRQKLSVQSTMARPLNANQQLDHTIGSSFSSVASCRFRKSLVHHWRM